MFKRLLMITLLLPTLMYGADVERVTLSTAAIEMKGNMYVAMEGESLYTHARIYTQDDKSYILCFKFTRLENGLEFNNYFRYTLTIDLFSEGRVKYNNAAGRILDCYGAVNVTFDKHGKLNLFDQGLLTESTVTPDLYIERLDGGSPMTITWKIPKGSNPQLANNDGLTSCDKEPSFISFHITNKSGEKMTDERYTHLHSPVE